jgi:hypothetical protein
MTGRARIGQIGMCADAQTASCTAARLSAPLMSTSSAGRYSNPCSGATIYGAGGRFDRCRTRDHCRSGDQRCRTVVLSGGATADNVFWQVGSSATLGTTADFKGNILTLTSISLATGAKLDGSALAQNGAVTLDTNTVTIPLGSVLVVPLPVPRHHHGG